MAKTVTRSHASPLPWRLGGPGHWVIVEEVTKGGPLRLRFWNKDTDNWKKRGLGYPLGEDREGAVLAWNAAVEQSTGNMKQRTQKAKGVVTVAELFGDYVRTKKKKAAPRHYDDLVRLAVVLADYFKPETDAAKVKRGDVIKYVEARVSGEFTHELLGRKITPGRKRKSDESPALCTFKREVGFINAAYTWANARELVTNHPSVGDKDDIYASVEQRQQMHPTFSHPDYLAILGIADEVDEAVSRERKTGKAVTAGSFKPYLMAVEALGWRSQEVGDLEAMDLVDMPAEPYVLKFENGSQVEVWGYVQHFNKKTGERRIIPFGRAARDAFDMALQRRRVVGKVKLFPYNHDIYSARLRAACKRLGIDLGRGMGFHSLRRKWVTERKHWPLKDILHAGAWSPSSGPMLLKSYLHADSDTVAQVVASEPVRLRARVL